MPLPISYLLPSSSLPSCFPILCYFSFYHLSLPCPNPSTMASTSFYSLSWVGWPSFLSLLTHIFSCPLESLGILTESEDSLGTCSKCRTVLGSGFLSEPLILGDWHLGDHIQASFVIGLDHRPLGDPSDAVASIPDTQLVIGPTVMDPRVTSLRCTKHTSLNGP